MSRSRLIRNNRALPCQPRRRTWPGWGGLSAMRMLPLGCFVIWALAAAPTMGAAGGADESEGTTLLRAEYAVFGSGASATWHGGLRNGASSGEPYGDASGERSSPAGQKVKAGLLSLLLPGAGQYYNGDTRKAYYFVGAEAAVWATYLTFHLQAESRTENYQEQAERYAGVTGEHNEAYWRALGRYMDSDAYNESVLREARAFGEEPTGLIGTADAWQWRNEERWRDYQKLRADANRAYDRRNFMTLFAVINRAIAVVDAVRSSVDRKLSSEVLGFQVEMDVSPSLHNPRTGCVISRRF